MNLKYYEKTFSKLSLIQEIVFNMIIPQVFYSVNRKNHLIFIKTKKRAAFITKATL